MLEEDYVVKTNFPLTRGIEGVSKTTKPLPASPAGGLTSPCQGRDCSVVLAIIREILLPEIEREVNEGRTFATLRQIYNAMILASWYKDNLKESLLEKVYVDKNKTTGVEVEDKAAKEKIYDQYLETVKKGVYNYIKEEYDEATEQMIPRKYFSGGFTGSRLSDLREDIEPRSIAALPAEYQQWIASVPAANDYAMVVDMQDIGPPARRRSN